MKETLSMLQVAAKVMQVLKSVSEKMDWPITPTIGGSVALFMKYGEFRKPHDVDIIIHAKDICKTDMLIKMALEYVIDKSWWCGYYYTEPSYLLKVDDVTINILIRDDSRFYDYDSNTCIINGETIRFEDVSTILDYKISWKRVKDLQDISYIEEIKNLKKQYGYES